LQGRAIPFAVPFSFPAALRITLPPGAGNYGEMVFFKNRLCTTFFPLTIMKEQIYIAFLRMGWLKVFMIPVMIRLSGI
jgi:hypothetical protein